MNVSENIVYIKDEIIKLKNRGEAWLSPIHLDLVDDKYYPVNKKSNFIKAYKDIDIVLPEEYEDLYLEISFNSYSYTSTIKILAPVGSLELKSIPTSVNKTYNIKISKKYNISNWDIEVEEKEYSGLTTIDNLIVWYSGADWQFNTVSGDFYYLTNRMDNTTNYKIYNQYTGKNTGYFTFPLFYGEDKNYLGKLGGKFVYIYDKLTADFGGTDPADHQRSLPSFNGEEFTIEVYLTASSYAATYNTGTCFTLGDTDNYIKLVNGSAGYISVKSAGAEVVNITGATVTGRSSYISIRYSVSEGKITVYSNNELVKEVSATLPTIPTKLLFGDIEAASGGSMGFSLYKDFKLYNKVLTNEESTKNYIVDLNGDVE